jgi:hypothetical protein
MVTFSMYHLCAFARIFRLANINGEPRNHAFNDRRHDVHGRVHCRVFNGGHDEGVGIRNSGAPSLWS